MVLKGLVDRQAVRRDAAVGTHVPGAVVPVADGDVLVPAGGGGAPGAELVGGVQLVELLEEGHPDIAVLDQSRPEVHLEERKEKQCIIKSGDT